MRPFTATLPLADALAIVQRAAVPVTRTERVSLEQANGRVVAERIVATADVPPFDRAAMDGYAVIAEDTFGAGRFEPRTLNCVAVVNTGSMPSAAVARGECVQIATGAPMPDGADAVVMVEETERGESAAIRIFTPVYPRQNVSRRGGDLASGAVVLTPGQVVNPSRLGALAATGTSGLDVYARPVVAILSTGDEIVEPGRPLAPAQIYDINRYTLSAIVSAHGGIPRVLAIAGDTIEEIGEGLAAASSADVIVLSGGSSVGDRDLILDVLQQTGEVLFHGIAVKPGKPTLFARLHDKPVLGMPGNPTSCLSNAYLLLAPLLRRIARLPEYTPQTVTLPLARRVVSTTGRHQFYTVRIEEGRAVPAFKASGDITSMSHADGYFEIPAHTDVVEAGELVDVKLF